MLLARFAVLGVLACSTIAPPCLATPIEVNYQASILESEPGVDQGLPIFLAGSPNNVRFRFFVPDFAALLAINSFAVEVDVYDDGDNSPGEAGAVLLVLNGIGEPNVTLQTFGGGLDGLNGFTAPAPFTVATSVPAGDLSNALLEIQGGGVFFIRVNRDGNDFFVGDARVTLAGELAVPEPASLGLLILGLSLLVCRGVRRPR